MIQLLERLGCVAQLGRRNFAVTVGIKRRDKRRRPESSRRPVSILTAPRATAPAGWRSIIVIRRSRRLGHHGHRRQHDRPKHHRTNHL
jgi:hypothetical protein